MKPDTCTGLTFPQLQASFVALGDDVPEGKLLGLIGGLMAKGLLAECAVHRGHYIATEHGQRVVGQYLETDV